LRQSRFRRDPRQLDEDEEIWFNDEDDDFEPIGPESSNGNSNQPSIGLQGSRHIFVKPKLF